MKLFWSGEGRYLSEFFINIFTFSTGISTNPLTQILSVLFISITNIYSTKVIFNQTKFLTISLISLIFLNPFYLQNMSYGYDNLPMTISTCCAVLSALLILQNRKYIYLSILYATCILLTYQATIGLYINFLIFIIFKEYLEGKLNNKNYLITKIIISLFIYLVLSIIYKVIFSLLFPNQIARVTIHIKNILPNLLNMIEYTKLLFYPHALIVFIFIVSIILISIVIIAIKNKKNIVIYLLITGTVFLLLLLNSPGPSILITPESNNIRVFIGISCLWLLAFYIISKFSKSYIM